jgi:hypothetical protein
LLTRELYDLKKDYNNSRDSRNYHVIQNWSHSNSLKEELGLVGNEDLQLKNLGPLNFIEKAVNFLKRRFDRFKHKSIFDVLSDLIKILNVENNEFGLENVGRKFIIWKKRKGQRWKQYAEIFNNCKLVKTRLKVKWKKRRRRIDSIISLLKEFIREFGSKTKAGFIWNLINKRSLQEFYLWRKYHENAKEKRKVKEFLLGRMICCDLSEVNLPEDINVLDCNMICCLKNQKWRKFKFKFKKRKRKWKQSEAFEEVFTLSKKEKIRLDKLCKMKSLNKIKFNRSFEKPGANESDIMNKGVIERESRKEK